MKKIAILLAFSLIASSAFAIVDDGTGSFGIYFDNAGDVNCAAPAPFTPFSLYFVIANPEVGNMGGFDFQWRFNPAPAADPIISGFVLPAGALNIGTNYNVIVGLGLGLITSEATVIAQANMLLMAAMPAETYIQVGPANPPTHPGHCVYNNFLDPAQIFDMNFATVDGVDVVVDPDGWVTPGVAKMSCPPPIATDPATWSGVKALFE